MSLGRWDVGCQDDLWIAANRIVRKPEHPFCSASNRAMAAAEFDRFVEQRCVRSCAGGGGGGAFRRCPRRVFPDAFNRVLRGDQLGAGRRIALRRLAGVAPVLRLRPERAHPRPLHAQRHPHHHRSGNPSGGLRLRARRIEG